MYQVVPKKVMLKTGKKQSNGQTEKHTYRIRRTPDKM